MSSKFSPSVNIILKEVDLTDYFITSNVQAVFDGILANYQAGIRSINLVGAYGTGKSSFLSAFEQHISGTKVFYENAPGLPQAFEPLRMVGEYDSFLSTFAQLIGAENDKPAMVLKAFGKYAARAAKEGKAVLLLVDEFGKLLEYAARHQPEKELYFLQQLAELVNNGPDAILWITTLHQDFSGYAHELTRLQRNEWTKVKGRFKEITFNEPVEQLLYLASERLNAEIPDKLRTQFELLLAAITEARIYPLRDFFTREVIEKLYPLDILSAAILSLSLQQYGQNERSLFSFLNGGNYYDLKDFDTDKHSFYTVSHVYDFLNYNLNSFLLSKGNPHYSKWAEIRNALERVEGEFGYRQQGLYQAIVKTIGLLQIFLPGNARITRDFLSTYVASAGEQTTEANKAITELEQKFIIRYYQRMHRYSLHEASDVDIDLAIHEASAEVSRANDVVKYLNTYFTFPTISAKRSYFTYGTPRVFQFKITDNPYISSVPEGEIDGFINLVFNPYLTPADIARVSAETEEAILYGLYQNSDEIRSLIEEIEKAEIAREKHKEDRIARRELEAIIDGQKNLLNHYVLHSFYNPDIVQWFYQGPLDEPLVNNRSLNALLSDICEVVYERQPVFKSEIANKSKLSPAASTARKDLFKALIDHGTEEDLSIVGFPPQKSIYYSLLKETGIHRPDEWGWALGQPTPENDNYRFTFLFEECDRFLRSAIGAKRSILELYELLAKKPFKLKRGFLDFWIPVFLLMKRNDFALYGEHGFITEFDGEVLELLVKRPQEYSLKAFDGQGIKLDLFNQYRSMLDLAPELQTSNASFIQTVVPYLKFYKGLHPYAKHTKRISGPSLKIRKALTDATDPEVLFFEDFPAALGYDIVQLHKNPELLRNFADALQTAIRELRSAYDELLNRFESAINSLWNRDLEFKEYKDRLRARYHQTLKKYLLLPYQRTFYERLCSPLEQRNAWLSSVAQATIGKTLENISDEEEKQLFDRFLRLIHELDNLNEFAAKQVDLDTEDVLRLEITVPGQQVDQQIIRMPKQRQQSFRDLENGLSQLLDNENQFTKIAILAELLRKELEKNGK